MDFNIIGTNVPVSNTYDNKGAHNQIKLMMQKGENLSIRFFSFINNYPYMWIESSRVARFKYVLQPKALTWIFNYLKGSGIDDFEINPMEIEAYKEGEEEIQFSIVKQLIEAGINIQWAPLFRERNNTISGIKDYAKGKILFQLPRTEKILDYLREHNQTI